jgi:acyl-CoA thioester hydrolase
VATVFGHLDDVAVAGFEYRHRVRYHETDAQHHVYNSRYLEYVDIAMTEFFRALGWDYPDLVAGGCDPALVRVELEFDAPARFDEEIDIGVRPARVGTSSFTLAFEISRATDGASVARANIVYVNLDTDTGRSRALPDDVRAQMTTLTGETATQ